MSKYIKLEDAIRKYAEMIADEAYWEHGVGNGKPDEEDLDIAREYYSDLPTIEVNEDCISREWLLRALNGYGKDWQEDCEIADVIRNAPSVVPTTEQSSKVGEWLLKEKENWLGKMVEVFECSVCGTDHFMHRYISDSFVDDLNFCPNCGAKMKG